MIGIFDSGLGGLSSLTPLRAQAPRADIVYLADTAALPLGEKSDREIRARVHAAVSLFATLGADAVLLACGTASSLFPEECKDIFAFPIFDIIKPTVKAAEALPREARIAILSTDAAARAGSFSAAFARTAHPVYSLACPALVRMAEGLLPRTAEGLEQALAPILPVEPQVVVLGCTHFSLLFAEISPLFPHARVLDAAACAAAAVTRVDERGICEGKGKTAFLTTGDPTRFAARAARILGYPVCAERTRLPLPS